MLLMNWKEFLKPDLKKILITIVLGLALFLGSTLLRLPIPYSIYDTLFFFQTQLITLVPPFVEKWILILIFYLLNLFELYLFSCLIIFIFHRLKK